MKSLRGHLLVASPYLIDPDLSRAVILVLDHTDRGAVGIMLNRPASTSRQELCKQLGLETVESAELQLRCGGGDSGLVVALHEQQSLAEMEIRTGLFAAADKLLLQQLLAGQETPVRLFVGQKNWTSGQLEDELQVGAWLTAPASIEHVFDDDNELWKKVIRQIGDSVLADSLNIKHQPPDPSWN